MLEFLDVLRKPSTRKSDFDGHSVFLQSVPCRIWIWISLFDLFADLWIFIISRMWWSIPHQTNQSHPLIAYGATSVFDVLLVFIKKKVTKVRDTNKLQLNRKTHYVAVVLWVAWSSEKWATFNRQLIVETFNKQELEGARGRPFTIKVQTRLPGKMLDTDGKSCEP